MCKHPHDCESTTRVRVVLSVWIERFFTDYIDIYTTIFPQGPNEIDVSFSYSCLLTAVKFSEFVVFCGTRLGFGDKYHQWPENTIGKPMLVDFFSFSDTLAI